MVRLEAYRILAELQKWIHNNPNKTELLCKIPELKSFIDTLNKIDFEVQLRAQQIDQVYDDEDELFTLVEKVKNNTLDCPE